MVCAYNYKIQETLTVDQKSEEINKVTKTIIIMKGGILLTFIIILFLPVTVSADASRTTGVGPLSVHFFADFVDSASTDEERSDRFHHHD